MKRVLILPLLIFTCVTVLAQNECRTAEYRQQLINKSPELISKIASIEAFTQNLQKAKSTTINGSSSSVNQVPTVITIPVVVHVVYNTAQQNISDQQIASQINVLNQDYNRLNPDTNNTPAVFRQYAANCGIHFELAKVDTSGYATTGIVRRHTNIIAFTIDDRIKSSAQGGDDAWDRDRYLNIWVGNLNSGVLGYSSVAGGPKEDDGVVVMYNAFGVNGSAAAPFNKGRTATHEIGHWLNLIHTWGDANCGDDKVTDTP
ncbi:MAG: zinc metalloprotease, partial [Bacteroidetes bacterium]|nr:zinc metalloprotease [Bacteroidota bacterium]